MIKKLTALILLFSVVPLFASGPRIVRFSSYDRLEKGSAKGLSITKEGELALAPEVRELFDSQEQLIWCTAVDRSQRIYLGTGNDGKVFAVDRDGAVAMLYDAEDPEIYALTVSPSGDLFFGTSPSAAIYTIPNGGESRQLADLECRYIWSMLRGENGDLYVATGEPGNVYKISGDGEVALLYASGETHLRSMTWSENGDLLLGSGNNGYLFRLSSEGQIATLYDSPYEEIVSIAALSDGTVYFTATRRDASSSAVSGYNASARRDTGVLEESTVELVLAPQRINGAARRQEMESALYKIDAEGSILEVWRSARDWAQCFVAADSGALYLGTGDRGKILALSARREMGHVATLDAMYITSLQRAEDGGTIVTTANPGKVYLLGPSLAQRGSYLSEVFDARVYSEWGQIRWRQLSPGSPKATVLTRSGNTASVDGTWSDWESYTRPEGEQIASPPARYLQWKVALSGAATVISDIEFAYLQKNLAPQIETITIHGPGEYFPPDARADNEESSNPSFVQSGIQRARPLGKAEFKKGYMSASWTFRDENSDFLRFDVLLKRSGSNSWIPLAKDYELQVLSWDSQLMMDGEYQMKISVSDAPSNPSDRAKSSEKKSGSFIIDNTAPEIAGLSRDRTSRRITFSVNDSWSPLQRVEMSINAGPWREVYPVDGLLDSKRETFEHVHESEPAGEYEIVVRATDNVGNIGFARTLIKGE